LLGGDLIAYRLNGAKSFTRRESKGKLRSRKGSKKPENPEIVLSNKSTRSNQFTGTKLARKFKKGCN
jgi:hypothetical protein